MKYVVVILDGAAGWPVAELAGRTTLAAAHTPNLDALARRGRVRELIASFRDSNREPFPLWEKTMSVPVPRQFAADAPGKFVM